MIYGELGREDTFGRVKVVQRHGDGKWLTPRIIMYGYSESFEFSYNVLNDLDSAINLARLWNRDTGEIVGGEVGQARNNPVSGEQRHSTAMLA